MKILPVNPKLHIIMEGQKHSTQLKKDATRDKENQRQRHIKLIKENIPVSKILCIGARDNSEVSSFIKTGFAAIGIDVTPESELVMKKDAHEINYAENAYDFVYASHVLEHLHDPFRVMQKIRKISKFGVFVILPITDKLRAGHPAIFDIMGDPSDKFTAYQDFELLEPYKIIHYKKARTEIEIMFTWNE